MPRNYYGTDGRDVVKQNLNRDYYNIYTYGGADEISLTLERTYVDAGGGNDKVTGNIEFNNDIFLGSGNDTYTGRGFTDRVNRFDVVHGNNGNDTFNIYTRASEYYGDDGRDVFNSVGYWNLIHGGKGRDMVSYALQDDTSQRGRGVFVDLFHEYATTDGNREEVLINIEDVEGTSVGDTLIGDSTSNRLWGRDGFDLLDGRGGKDKLYGGNGNDKLYGGANADLLVGGRGSDLLEGGGGKDTFVFNGKADSAVGAKRDVITDFSSSERDKIDLSGFGGLDFIGDADFSGSAGELRFENEILAVDTNGDGKADFEVKLEGVDSLSLNDFIL